MTTTPSQGPTWYDILGLGTDASPEEIKAAWRTATDKFEPGSGTSQFRLFNEAADVLLDPVKRNAYDAELAGGTTAGDVAVAPDAPVAPVAPVDEPVSPAAETTAADEADAAVAADAEAVPEPADDAPEKSGLLGRLGRISNFALILLAVVAIAAAVAVDLLAMNIKSRTDVAQAGPDASAAASRALTSVLAYDYRHMDADRDRSANFLTPSYRKEYLKTFGLLTQGADGQPGPAVKTKTVVTADVLSTGVADAEKDRVRVVVFVNQSSVKGSANPAVFQNRVVATMVHRGDAWLLDGVKSY